MEYVFQAHMQIMGRTVFYQLFLVIWLSPLLCSCKSNVVTHEFDSGSKYLEIILDSSKIEDLVLLCHIWGFLKYYHPAVVEGDYNWDGELFRILPLIINTNDDGVRNQLFLEWIRSLGAITSTRLKVEEQGDVVLTPDLTWIDANLLGDELAMQLTTVKNAKRPGSNYYVRLIQGVGNPEFTHEEPYDSLHYPDIGIRLLSLFRYWNIIRYFYPYRDLTGTDWDEILKEFVPVFVNASDALEYNLALLKLIANVHDTHANIWSNSQLLREYKGRNYVPVEVSFIEGKAVVSGPSDSAYLDKYRLQMGDIILSVGNETIDQILARKLPFTPASNYPTQLRDIGLGLLRTNDAILPIEYSRGDTVMSTNIRTVAMDNHFYDRYLYTDTCYQAINGNIAYLYFGSLKKEYLPEIMPAVLQSKGLIIDLRCYPSDFLVFTFGEYLFSAPMPFVKFSTASIAQPGLFVSGEHLKVGRVNPKSYTGKVVILVNESTQSSAEYHAMAFRAMPGAIVVGSTTAGADGNVSRIVLPGGINTMISGIGVYYPDGTGTQRVGIIPDIEVKPTIQGIKEGRDEVLEYAIELIGNK